MNIRLYIAVSDPLEQSKANLVNTLSESLNSHFQNKDFGDDVRNIEIGMIMTFEREGYEEWYKPRRMAYTRAKTIKHKLTGEVLQIEKELKYEIKFNDQQLDKYVNNNDLLSKEILMEEILNSLSKFDKLPGDIKDFDEDGFRVALKRFFETTK